MTDKCREIILAIRDLSRGTGDGPGESGYGVSFTSDWGGNSLTVEIAGKGHTHVGDPDATDDELIEALHALLCRGRGLSFVQPEEPKGSG